MCHFQGHATLAAETFKEHYHLTANLHHIAHSIEAALAGEIQKLFREMNYGELYKAASSIDLNYLRP